MFSDLISEGQVESASHERSDSQTRARLGATSLFHRVPGSAMQMNAGKLLSVFAQNLSQHSKHELLSWAIYATRHSSRTCTETKAAPKLMAGDQPPSRAGLTAQKHNNYKGMLR